jgi:hypothetical protein
MRFTVGQGLLYVAATGRSRHAVVQKVGSRWLHLDDGTQIDRKTLKAKARRGFESPGRVWLTLDDYVRFTRRHSAWRHFRQQVQDKWGPPDNVTLEQIQAAADLLRLAAYV